MELPPGTTDGLSADEYKKLAALIRRGSASKLPHRIVNAPFTFPAAMAWLFLGFICVYVVEDDAVQLVAATSSDYYKLAVEHYKFHPEQFRLSLTADKTNTIVKAITTAQPQTTTDWTSVSRHGADLEAVRLNQANSGIAYTVIYPFEEQGTVRGALMYNFYQYPMWVGEAQWEFMKRYTAVASDCLLRSAAAA